MRNIIIVNVLASQIFLGCFFRLNINAYCIKFDFSLEKNSKMKKEGDIIMNLLKRRILQEGIALNQNVLKVDSFLNHQVDPKLMYEVGKAFKDYFENCGITKVVTIESSGIAPAVMTAIQMNIPMIILKKQKSKILSGEVYQKTVHSFTKNLDYELTLSKKYICKDDKVLIIDDFLAYGEAALGAISVIEQAGANVLGIGIVIEKSFQPGRKILEDNGYNIYSLAKISKLGEGIIEFVEE